MKIGSHRARALLAVLAAVGGGCLGLPRSAAADESVVACGPMVNGVFAAYGPIPYGLVAQATCPGGAITLANPVSGFTGSGVNAIWQASAPGGLFIRSAWVPSMYTYGVNDGNAGQYGGDFYWGPSGTSLIYPNEGSASFPNIDAQDFGFNLVCGANPCNNSATLANISVQEALLTVAETSGPSLTSPTGLWQTRGWIRGTWNLSFDGDSPSGLCTLAATFDGQTLPGIYVAPNQSTWHQCAAPAVNDPVATAGFPDGALSLHIGATDAAGLSAWYDKTVYVDNQSPTVSLSGPTDAPSTAGTQYVTATAAAGPSGVAGISCSVDGGPAQWYAGSTAQVPVGGIGQHQVRCVSENNAVDANGGRGSSSPAVFGIKIGQPTVAAVSFNRIVDRLRCTRAYERVRVRGRWVVVLRRHRVVRIRRRWHFKLVEVRRCHPHTALRRVSVRVPVRHGRRTLLVRRRRTIRVVVLPHTVAYSRRRVRHGHGTTVDGWLGTDTGVALAGQAVDVLTAPDNGRNSFRVAAVAVTGPDGSWSAHLPKGPSRLVEAYYPGGGTTESSASAPIKLVVPAEVELLSVAPHAVAWGGTVRLTGRLKGGYLPPGGALVRLRIGYGPSYTTYGVETHVTGRGRFTTTYTFGLGAPGIHRSYWFQIASLPMGDYPYAPASSRRVSVLVGGHPAARRSFRSDRRRRRDRVRRRRT